MPVGGFSDTLDRKTCSHQVPFYPDDLDLLASCHLMNITGAMKQTVVGCFYRGHEQLPSHKEIIYSKPLQGSLLNNQDSTESKSLFFRGSLV